jgi:phosphate acyltransferase
MTGTLPVALDAMGTDRAPAAEIEGAVAAVRERGARVVLVGDETRLRAALQAAGAAALGIEVRHASQVITMHDAPAQVVRKKTDSSMRVCFDLCKRGEASAVVSAGNSGAMLACGLFVLKRLPKVERPAIVTTFPTPVGPCALLDMGANVECKPRALAQFAVLGTVYARLLHRKARPRVGLLANGSEDHKGTDLTRDTHALLSRVAALPGGADFDYAGYVEGRDIFAGVDVVVTDGFTGNVVLKTVEGTAAAIFDLLRREIAQSRRAQVGALLLRPAFTSLRALMDYAEYGGAPLLGVDGVAMVCHGSSNAKAIKNAVFAAQRFVDLGLKPQLERAIEKHRPIWENVAPSAASGGGGAAHAADTPGASAGGGGASAGDGVAHATDAPAASRRATGGDEAER